jgi:hypothetical protein
MQPPGDEPKFKHKNAKRHVLEGEGERKNYAVVSWKDSEESEPFITNPELYAEIGLFAALFLAGCILIFHETDAMGESKRYGFGIIFLSAGSITSVSDVLASLVRHRLEFLQKPLNYITLRKLILYLSLLVTGAALVAIDSEGEYCSIKSNWAYTFGYITLEAGLVYWAFRFFLFDQAASDEIRNLKDENKDLLENIATMGISEGYFLNFARIAAIDILPKPSIQYFVCVVPFLEACDFNNTNPKYNPIKKVVDKLRNRDQGWTVVDHTIHPYHETTRRLQVDLFKKTQSHSSWMYRRLS